MLVNPLTRCHTANEGQLLERPSLLGVPVTSHWQSTGDGVIRQKSAVRTHPHCTHPLAMQCRELQRNNFSWGNSALPCCWQEVRGAAGDWSGSSCPSRQIGGLFVLYRKSLGRRVGPKRWAMGVHTSSMREALSRIQNHLHLCNLHLGGRRSWRPVKKMQLNTWNAHVDAVRMTKPRPAVGPTQLHSRCEQGLRSTHQAWPRPTASRSRCGWVLQVLYRVSLAREHAPSMKQGVRAGRRAYSGGKGLYNREIHCTE